MNRYDKKEKYLLAVYISIFIFLASGTVLSSYLYYRSFEQQFRAQTERQLSIIAKLKVNELSNWREERLNDAETLRQNLTFAELAQAYLKNPQDVSAQTQIQAWLESYQVNGYDRVRLLDTQGNTILSAPASAPPISSLVAQQIPEDLQSKQVVMVDFYYSDPDQRIDLTILIPITNSQSGDQVIGLVSFNVNPQTYLYPYIIEWPSDSTTAETLLIRRDGNEALFLNPLRFDPNAALSLHFPLTDTNLPAVKAVLGQSGVVTGLDYRGKQVLADVRPVPDSPWFLVSKMDITEVDAPLTARLWLTLLLAGTAILVAGASLMTIQWQQRLQFYRTKAEAAEALRSSEEKFRLAFDTSPDSIAITRLKDGMFVSVNKGFENISGYSQKEIIGKTSAEINIWKNPEDRRKVVEGLQANSQVQNYEAPFLTRSGEIYGMMSAVIIELNGEPHILNITRDITERKQAEEKLHESEERFRRAVLGAPFPILIHAEDGEVVFVNTPWSKLTGYEHSDIPTIAEWTQKAYGTRMELVRADIDKLYALDGPKAEGEYTIMTRSGQARIWDFSSAPIGQLPDRRRLVISMAMDITERKQAEDQIKEQLEELLRWQNAVLGREDRVLDLKREVNDLLKKAGLPPRYESAK